MGLLITDPKMTERCLNKVISHIVKTRKDTPFIRVICAKDVKK